MILFQQKELLKKIKIQIILSKIKDLANFLNKLKNKLKKVKSFCLKNDK
jgi:hypothetical protein